MSRLAERLGPALVDISGIDTGATTNMAALMAANPSVTVLDKTHLIKNLHHILINHPFTMKDTCYQLMVRTGLKPALLAGQADSAHYTLVNVYVAGKRAPVILICDAYKGSSISFGDEFDVFIATFSIHTYYATAAYEGHTVQRDGVSCGMFSSHHATLCAAISATKMLTILDRHSLVMPGPSEFHHIIHWEKLGPDFTDGAQSRDYLKKLSRMQKQQGILVLGSKSTTPAQHRLKGMHATGTTRNQFISTYGKHLARTLQFDHKKMIRYLSGFASYKIYPILLQCLNIASRVKATHHKLLEILLTDIVAYEHFIRENKGVYTLLRNGVLHHLLLNGLNADELIACLRTQDFMPKKANIKNLTATCALLDKPTGQCIMAHCTTWPSKAILSLLHDKTSINNLNRHHKDIADGTLSFHRALCIVTYTSRGKTHHRTRSLPTYYPTVLACVSGIRVTNTLQPSAQHNSGSGAKLVDASATPASVTL